MTAEEAKSASHVFLQSHKIQINSGLPVIESIEDLVPQTAQAIARRCVILSHVIAVVGYGADVRKLKDALTKFGLFEYASQKEQDLLNRASHSSQEKTDATWLAECVQSLAWCVNLVGMSPFRRCDDDLASHFPPPFSDPSAFINSVIARPLEEIYQQADLHYRLHWAGRNARLTRVPSIAHEGLIGERRKGLDWAIGVEADWDRMPDDT